MELTELRGRIDAIDSQIIQLVQQRMDVAAEIAGYKREKGLPVLDAGRESAKLEAVAASCREGMGEYMARLYKEMFSISRDYQQKLLESENG